MLDSRAGRGAEAQSGTSIHKRTTPAIDSDSRLADQQTAPPAKLTHAKQCLVLPRLGLVSIVVVSLVRVRAAIPSKRASGCCRCYGHLQGFATLPRPSSLRPAQVPLPDPFLRVAGGVCAASLVVHMNPAPRPLLCAFVDHYSAHLEYHTRTFHTQVN